MSDLYLNCYGDAIEIRDTDTIVQRVTADDMLRVFGKQEQKQAAPACVTREGIEQAIKRMTSWQWQRLINANDMLPVEITKFDYRDGRVNALIADLIESVMIPDQVDGK